MYLSMFSEATIAAMETDALKFACRIRTKLDAIHSAQDALFKGQEGPIGVGRAPTGYCKILSTDHLGAQRIDEVRYWTGIYEKCGSESKYLMAWSEMDLRTYTWTDDMLRITFCGCTVKKYLQTTLLANMNEDKFITFHTIGNDVRVWPREREQGDSMEGWVDAFLEQTRHSGPIFAPHP